MPNIHGVPGFHNIGDITNIIEKITAKHGKLGGRRITYTDANQNHYVFKMDQLVQNLLVFANQNEDKRQEILRILSLLEAKDTELKKPANIESSGWTGFKKAITRLTSHLGRLKYKRDRLIAETKESLRNLIKGDIEQKADTATETEAEEFIQQLEEFFEGTASSSLKVRLEDRIVDIHKDELSLLFNESTLNFEAIEEALEKLPRNNDNRWEGEKKLKHYKDFERKQLQMNKAASDFLERREWCDSEAFQKHRAAVRYGSISQATRKIRDSRRLVEEKYEQEERHYKLDFKNFPFRLKPYPPFGYHIKEAQQEISNIQELLNEKPGRATAKILNDSLIAHQQNIERFKSEIEDITKKVQENAPFTKEDFPVLARVSAYHRNNGQAELTNLFDACKQRLDKEYKTRDALINQMERNLFNLSQPVYTDEKLQQDIYEMPEGPAKKEVLEKLTIYEKAVADHNHYKQVWKDIRSATSLEEIDKIADVAEKYKYEVNAVKKEARSVLLGQLADKKIERFKELLTQDASADQFEDFFSSEDMKLLDDYNIKRMNETYEALKTVRGFFQDPTRELKFPYMGYYFSNYRLQSIVNLLKEIGSGYNRNIPTERDMQYLTEEQQQCVLGRAFKNQLSKQHISIVDAPIERLSLCVKCGIPLCENFAESTKTDVYKAFAQPDFQARLQRLWAGPFEKASEEDLAVICNALDTLKFQPLISESLKMILKMQEMGIHFSQKCPLSQQYLTNPVKLDEILYDRNALNSPTAEEVPGLGALVEAWISLKSPQRTSSESLFDSIFTLRKRAEVRIENSQYDNFFEAAKKNKEIIQKSEGFKQDVKNRALEINYTLAAMMHPVDIHTATDEQVITQAAWLVPNLRMFTLNLMNEIGPELTNKIRADLNNLESILETYSTHAELNPALFSIMTTYSEIIEKVFGSSVNLNLILVEVSIPQKKRVVLDYETAVKNSVKEGKLSIDETCTLPLIKRLVRKLVLFLQTHNLEANEREIELFEERLETTTNQSKAFENEAKVIKRAIERRTEMQAQRLPQKVEVKQQLRMMYN